MKTIYDMRPKDLENLLVGHKVVSVSTDDNSLVLDNGTTLILEDTSDCCAWFDATLEDINLEGNIITALKVDNLPDGFAITILSESEEIGRVSVEGSLGSGYYCSSVNLIVVGVG